MKEIVAIMLTTIAITGACFFGIGFNHARHNAQLVEVNNYGYTIQYGEGSHAFYDYYEGNC